MIVKLITRRSLVQIEPPQPWAQSAKSGAGPFHFRDLPRFQHAVLRVHDLERFRPPILYGDQRKRSTLAGTAQCWGFHMDSKIRSLEARSHGAIYGL